MWSEGELVLRVVMAYEISIVSSYIDTASGPFF